MQRSCHALSVFIYQKILNMKNYARRTCLSHNARFLFPKLEPAQSILYISAASAHTDSSELRIECCTHSIIFLIGRLNCGNAFCLFFHWVGDILLTWMPLRVGKFLFGYSIQLFSFSFINLCVFWKRFRLRCGKRETIFLMLFLISSAKIFEISFYFPRWNYHCAQQSARYSGLRCEDCVCVLLLLLCFSASTFI